MDHIEKTLLELYELDGELKKHEKELKKALLRLSSLKPATGFDQQFAQKLKAEILSRAPSPRERSAFIPHFLTMLRINRSVLLASLSGVLALALVITNVPFRNHPDLAKAYQITRVGQNAFGSLNNAQNSAPSSANGASEAASTPSPTPLVASGMGGGASGTVAPALDKRMANSVSDSMIAPDVYRPITYRYAGDELPALTTEQMEVFKRLKPGSGLSLAELGGLSNNLINLNSFSNAFARNIEIVEDRDKGYVVNLSLAEGVASISQNWEKWNTCPNGICPQYPPLTEADVPANDELISIAQNFLASHGVSIEGYGAPLIEEQPRYYLMDARPSAATSPARYVPESMTVVYPLTLNGQTVYEMGGGAIGIRVSINIRDKQVTGAWDIRSNQYQSSLYETETDTARLIRIAEQGGSLYGFMPKEDNSIVLELGTPTISLARTWQPSKDGMNQEEIFVPVYNFPIKPLSEENQKLLPYYQPMSIMVPLVKELLVNADKPLPTPQPLPIDAMIKSEPAVSNPPTLDAVKR